MLNRVKLLLLMLLLAAPLLISTGMYTLQAGIPEARVAKGELLPELEPLQEWPLAWQATGEWWLVWVAEADCNQRCEAQADELWRMHRALGREADRVYRLRAGGSSELPGEKALPWLDVAPPWAVAGNTWLVDPEGRVVLAYDLNTPAAEIHRDLTRLLRINR
ncbi:MAG: hypothetical protein IBX50_14210 [Marinospirillum sp.]|uniref:hypothetical protein n=1 Tax=Marinospirillum sp. TaxID=2183934 RepID=UPI001A0B0640|nr:hypothetical protein [Marinospirillum sp.]MBE0507842.1 hypothetical protein [Marinospirillum sp.]